MYIEWLIRYNVSNPQWAKLAMSPKKLGGGHSKGENFSGGQRVKYCKKILDLYIQYILQHVDKISANSEMVEQEAFVELSWNDSYVNHLERHIPLYPARYMQTYIHIYKEKSSSAKYSDSLKRRITLSHAHCSVC